MKIYGRQVSIVGYSSKLAIEHLLNHIESPQSKRWCSVACMARTMYGRDTAKNRKAVRKNGRVLFRRMLDRSQFLVIEYGESHGEILAFKIYEKDVDLEAQAAQLQIDRMSRRQELNAEQMAIAKKILGMPD